ncbi:hypothetical protein E3N88_21600 [Mikania micrantha]|uniref:Uncharacterized protein n=1 Tax=Mikania micrantha TaxID=192012 RepID=A0A5N6N8Z5_9ASTR|nr:hypothetical protein E3N88_21600 [Mikania micrantha]
MEDRRWDCGCRNLDLKVEKNATVGAVVELVARAWRVAFSLIRKFKQGQTIVRKRENGDERIKPIEIGLLGSLGAHRGTRWPNRRPTRDTRPTSRGFDLRNPPRYAEDLFDPSPRRPRRTFTRRQPLVPAVKPSPTIPGAPRD